MSIDTLYNKYRPKNFDDVLFQDPIIRILKNSIEKNRISHSYLFSGKKGTGKTSLGRILAKAINCNSKIRPCNSCPSCEAIDNKRSNDIIEIDAASYRGVDDIEKIIGDSRFLPSFGNKKIYILDECHSLSSTAFNALLKSLEEAPKHIVFILCTTQPENLPDTIVSRCIHLTFKNPNIKELEIFLEKICQKENIPYEKDALNYLATQSSNSFRDALVNLEKFSDGVTSQSLKEIYSTVDTKIIVQFIYCMVLNKEKECIHLLNKFVDDGGAIKDLIRDSTLFSRVMNLYLLGESNDIILSMFNESLCKMAKYLENKIEDKRKIKDILIFFLSFRSSDRFIDQVNLELSLVEFFNERKI